MAAEAKQCFTEVQNRRMWETTSEIFLCPSMDLIVFGEGLFRTISYQKIAKVCNVMAFGPDGRSLVVFDDKLKLYCLEDLLIASPPANYESIEETKVDHIAWFHKFRSIPQYQATAPPLPASEYHKHAKREPSNLSVLVVTSTNELKFYLHGQYEFCNVPGRNIVASTPDLCHFVSSDLNIYSIPLIAQQTETLHTISIRYSKIQRHLDLQPDTLFRAFSGALRALDSKFEALQKLFPKYGLDDDVPNIRKSLLEFMNGSNKEVNSVVEQFVSTQHDPLLHRLERSLTSAVANAEQTLRRQLLAPVIALLQDVDQLNGYHENIPNVSGLFEIIQKLLFAVIQARFRLNDIMEWLRSTSSIYKKTTKKRFVSDALILRVRSYLQEPCDNSGSLTEQLFQLGVSHFEETVLKQVETTRSAIDEWFRNVIEPVHVHSLKLSIPSDAVTTRTGQKGIWKSQKQWVVSASYNKNIVTLNAVPLMWTTEDLDDCYTHVGADQNYCALAERSCLSVDLKFPSNYLVLDVGFYGDDGKSSLATDTEVPQEGRQALGALLSRDDTLELWMLEYDELIYTKEPLQNTPSGFERLVMEPETVLVYSVVAADSYGSSMEVVYARTRKLSANPNDVSFRMKLSGSRGIAAIVTSSHRGGSLLEVFDLEEDENDEDDSDDESEEQEDGMVIE